MTITKETLEHVAKVARIELSEEEKEKFLPQLQEILKAFSTLDEIDVHGFEPAFHPVPIEKHVREDKVEKSLSQEEALANAQHKEGGYIKGPKAV